MQTARLEQAYEEVHIDFACLEPDPRAILHPYQKESPGCLKPVVIKSVLHAELFDAHGVRAAAAAAAEVARPELVEAERGVAENRNETGDTAQAEKQGIRWNQLLCPRFVPR